MMKGKPISSYAGIGIADPEDKKSKEEPEPEEPPHRTWFKRNSDGQLAYLVTDPDDEDGPHMRLDRAMQDIRIPIRLNRDGSIPADFPGWTAVPDRELRQLTVGQVAQIAFAADKALCFLLGMPDAMRRDWMSLSDEQKRDWVRRGPVNDSRRRRLYAAVFHTFKQELDL